MFNGTLSPLVEIMLSLINDTSSPLGESLDLLDRTSIEASDKTFKLSLLV